MSRHPRGAGAGAALTRTEQLRQARTAALVKSIAQREEAVARQQVDPSKVRRKISRTEPKKVDFAKPGMTKAMLARIKQAEKFKQEYERRREVVTARVPRTPAPVGGDARSRQ